MPPGAFKYPGTVNHKAFTFFLDQESTYFTCEAETLLMQPAGVEFGVNADMSISYNMIYRFIYRPQKHNFFFYYPGSGSTGSGSGSGARWSWQRIALDIAALIERHLFPVDFFIDAVRQITGNGNKLDFDFDLLARRAIR